MSIGYEFRGGGATSKTFDVRLRTIEPRTLIGWRGFFFVRGSSELVDLLSKNHPERVRRKRLMRNKPLGVGITTLD